MAAGQGSEISKANILPGPEGPIAARVLAKNKEKREAMKEALGIAGVDVDLAIADAVDMADLLETMKGGKRRVRGGGITEDIKRQLASLSNKIAEGLQRRLGGFQRDFVVVRDATSAVGGEIVEAAGMMGRYTTLGVYTGILALTAAGAQYIPGPTWGQVFNVAVESASNIGSAASSGAVAVVSNPILTLAAATAIMKWRARNQPEGAISVAELMKRDAAAVGGAIQKRLVASASPPATLREIANRVRSQPGPAGQGAREMRARALSSGAPSAEMGVEDGTMALVPARQRDPGAPIRRLSGVMASPGSFAAAAAAQQTAARSGLSSSFGSADLPPVGMDEEGSSSSSSSSSAAPAPAPAPAPSSSSSGYNTRGKKKKEGGATCGGRRRPLSAPTRRVKRSSSSSKKGYTRRQRALRS
jgi:hypothetical protein